MQIIRYIFRIESSYKRATNFVKRRGKTYEWIYLWGNLIKIDEYHDIV